MDTSLFFERLFRALGDPECLIDQSQMSRVYKSSRNLNIFPSEPSVQSSYRNSIFLSYFVSILALQRKIINFRINVHYRIIKRRHSPTRLIGLSLIPNVKNSKKVYPPPKKKEKNIPKVAGRSDKNLKYILNKRSTRGNKKAGGRGRRAQGAGHRGRKRWAGSRGRRARCRAGSREGKF